MANDAASTHTRPLARSRSRTTRSRAYVGASDRGAVVADLVRFVWRRKLWWLAPLLVALLLLAVLVVLEATPIGPLLYPVF